MNKFKDTISEISNIFNDNEIQFVLIGFDKNNTNKLNDLDILVRSNFFQKSIQVLEANGYKSSSHDQALGGRTKNMQMNLTKLERINIDLHQDFTWRSSKYFDLDLIWKNLIIEKIENVNFHTPEKVIDVFLVIVKIIFEKTYFKKEEYFFIKGIINEISSRIELQVNSSRFGWEKSFNYFIEWFMLLDTPRKWPIFLPISLVINSYVEKFQKDKKINFVSLVYYFFFRVRFVLNKVLPYD